MKIRIGKLLLAILFCLLFALPVCANQKGSLRLIDVEKPVMLFPVTDSQWQPKEVFTAAVEGLTPDDLTSAEAKRLHQYVRDQQLTGEIGTVDEKNEISFSSLEEGCYLICSMAEKAEFAPFLLCVPMTIGEKCIYDIQAEPKVESPVDPSSPSDPMAPNPNIPQTGAIEWPKYLLLCLGAAAIGAGLFEVIKGREKSHE